MDPISINVSQLCAAVIDPQWRQQFLANENPSTRSYSPPQAMSVHGSKFHRFARELVDELLTDSNHSINLTEEQLYTLLVSKIAGSFVNGLLQDNNINEASAFLDALQRFATRIVSCRNRSVNASAWSDIFEAREYSIRNVQFKTDDRIVFVSGIIDGLRRHPNGQLEIVDYKLSKGGELDKDLVQIALYDWLVKAQGIEHNTRGCLEYYQPELCVLDASADELESIFEQKIRPVLLEIANHTPSPETPSSLKQKTSDDKGSDEPKICSVLLEIDNHVPSPETPSSIPKPSRDTEDEPSLIVGETNRRQASTVTLPFSSLVRHTAVLGGSGSGKTTLALNLLEQLLMQGVPVLLVDRKGDLCRYAAPELQKEPQLASFFEKVQVNLFTPGNAAGRQLAINLIPERMNDLHPVEQEHAFRTAAQGLGSMMGLKSSPKDQARIAVLVRALQMLDKSEEATTDALQALIEMTSTPDETLRDSLGGIGETHLKWLAEQLQTLSIMKGELFESSGERLSAELLLGLDKFHPPAGKTQLSIVSTKFLGDEQTALFWVAQLLVELQRFASRSPAPHLQAVVMFDEADLYLPAIGKPVTKTPMESLLKRARSAGLGIVLASQSPGDLDYKSRENIRTWFMGLIKQKTALDKLKPVLAESNLNGEEVLPKQKVGEFFMVSEKMATPLKSHRSLVETQQMSEVEILNLAKLGNKKPHEI